MSFHCALDMTGMSNFRKHLVHHMCWLIPADRVAYSFLCLSEEILSGFAVVRLIGFYVLCLQ